MAISESERIKIIKEILPDTVNGNIRPTDYIPSDFPESTTMPQLISQDPNKFTIFNLLMRQAMSNDASLRADIDSAADKIQGTNKLLFLQRGTGYVIGDVRLHEMLPVNYYLECTKAGSTGTTSSETIPATPGKTIQDGTSAWTIRKMMTTNAVTVSSSKPIEMKPGTIWYEIISEEDN